jgi:hypothetical protein
MWAKEKKNTSPVFQGKKTKNLGFRVFFASLPPSGAGNKTKGNIGG